MIRNIFIASLFLLLGTGFFACTNEQAQTENQNWVTERIEYDVQIVSKSQDQFHWWDNNIEGSSRESFIDQIFDRALSGKLKVHHPMSYNALTPEDIKRILAPRDTVTVFDANDPGIQKDTVIVSEEISKHDIVAIRFLEAWQMDPESLQMTKKVLGICPVVPYVTPDGVFMGNRDLFWIYFDENYPEKLK